MTRQMTYPFSNINIQEGDILYSPISRSTYYVGHTVIIGEDFLVKESIPGYPSGHNLTINQFWNRHHKGDKITLLRSQKGAKEAAKWATEQLHYVKHYRLSNFNINNIKRNYCSKFIVQAYYHGAQVRLTNYLNRFISPQFLKEATTLDKIALFKKG